MATSIQKAKKFSIKEMWGIYTGKYLFFTIAFAPVTIAMIWLYVSLARLFLA